MNEDLEIYFIELREDIKYLRTTIKATEQLLKEITNHIPKSNKEKVDRGKKS